MRRLALLAGAGGLLAAWVGWGAYVDRTTEGIPYETIAEFDGVELRRYPRTVLAETTAADEDEAFRRLFRYISGENESGEEVSMTAPVATEGQKVPTTAPVRTRRDAPPAGEEISMTTPVRTAGATDGVTMAFYLPAEYDPDDAPIPTDTAVRLAVEPPRTLAVERFSWYATDDRVEKYREALLDALERRGLEPRTRPVVFQYDDPWTPPFMRRNEVAVEIAAEWEAERKAR
ncbi:MULTISPECIES: SOUL family heme-binding protein [Halorussus]|uniref:SOUL family heme-binding protein n=1 Tax=Halorussus TaxID=1070314 RepID=UPI0034A5CC97